MCRAGHEARNIHLTRTRCFYSAVEQEPSCAESSALLSTILMELKVSQWRGAFWELSYSSVPLQHEVSPDGWRLVSVASCLNVWLLSRVSVLEEEVTWFLLVLIVRHVTQLSVSHY